MTTMFRPRAGLLLLLLAGCPSGPGAEPVFRDATVRAEAGPVDVGHPDAADPQDSGPRDVPIGVFDAGFPPEFPFTGFFGILNSSDRLFAREVEGKLALVVGEFPYVYEGTIAANGTVDVTSPTLIRSGCATARVSGIYERAGAAFILQHETCNARLEPVSSQIRGGFGGDFMTRRSGVYALTADVVADLEGCYLGPQTGNAVRYAVNVLADGTASVFTAFDLIDTPAQYIGRFSTAEGFQAIQRIDGRPNPQAVAMSGTFTQVGTVEPSLSADRDVFDAARSCVFRIHLEGQRVSGP